MEEIHLGELLDPRQGTVPPFVGRSDQPVLERQAFGFPPQWRQLDGVDAFSPRDSIA